MKKATVITSIKMVNAIIEVRVFPESMVLNLSIGGIYVFHLKTTRCIPAKYI
ncbi:MAG TPA: hypothetical protein VE130_13140 [Nitrososphaeraceae archaeon]|jgi:hypothetical protein|nr:hypothetical protein [Nitrososphaeraceae archaeon]